MEHRERERKLQDREGKIVTVETLKRVKFREKL